MIYKKCNKCGKIKEIIKFGKSKKTNDGYNIYCKKCGKIRSNGYRKTKDGIVTTIYSSQIQSSKKRGHQPPAYTKEELKEWLFKQDLFHELYDLWVASGYNKWQKPSVDRLNNSKGYSFDNIRLVTWKENDKQAHEDIKVKKLKNSGLLNGGHKTVLQFDKQGNFIAEYISLGKATRQTNIPHPNIVKVCQGKRKTAGGCIWKYKD